MEARRICFGHPAAHEPDRLVLGDNGDVAASLADGCLDLIYIDPPFGTGARRRGGRDRDEGVQRGYRDVPDDPEPYVAWLRDRLTQCHRLLAPHGSLFVHLDYRTVHYVKIALDRIFGRELFINEIVWCYSVGGKSPRMFGRKHDTILWYARSTDYAFFPEAVKVARKPASHMRMVRTSQGELVQEKTDRRTGKVYRYPVTEGKVPEDWWTDIEILNRGDAERTGWPTQKPERLLERIVKATSTEGARVADFFAGSATTGVVAQRLGRRFLLVDREPAAIACAAARLAAAGRHLATAGHVPRDVVVESWPEARPDDARRRGSAPAGSPGG